MQQLRILPNQLTLIRFIGVPILWLFALRNEPGYIGIGLIIALATDILDGYFARAWHLVSNFGAKFDSLADFALTVSAVIWILMLKPEIVSENVALVTVAVAMYVVALLAGWLKFGPLAVLDLYSAKITAPIEYLFLIHAFLFGRYNQALLYFALGMSIISCAETLVLRLTQSHANVPVRSVLGTPVGNFVTIPNLLSGLRLVLIPVMWIWAFSGLTTYLGIGLLVAFLSDVLGGMAARMLNQFTEFGSQFDPLVDHLMLASAILWVAKLRSQVFSDYPGFIFVSIALYLIAMSIELFKHRRIGTLHPNSSKLANVLLYVFIIHTFLFTEGYHQGLFFAGAGVFTLSSTARIVALLIRS